MRFSAPLLRATLIRRYKRFLADIRLADGTEVTAHCPNPGSMMGLAEPGLTCWLSDHRGTARKLPYGWELVEFGGTTPRPHFVGINTNLANGIVAEALAASRIPALRGYAETRREVRLRQEVRTGTESRLDFHLHDEERGDCFVEVKSVTLSRRPGLAEFPDARTARGARHLQELARLAQQGKRAVLLFLLQRDDCRSLRFAQDIDPGYVAALQAVAPSIEILAYACDIGPEGIELAGPVTIELTCPTAFGRAKSRRLIH
ncbi:DNA/RNA nuclease SfsA [Dongia soli]|uniref:Sugar fermentation stimulation protein homolog n=1 Tax=Dongia soli TaxID=600628 RepID=A0ABU5EHL7_9PROT|nr:DNA/RNA nuclease SfsA [Dongia soli]MDY0885716.1 DNA/RNA nuclease SfsA [Dongia soli]